MAWRQAAENLCKYQKKGALLGVEGRIQTGSYEDKDGKRVYTTDIQCDNVQYLEPKQQGFASDEQRQVYDDTKGFEERKKYESIEVDPDSSLPF